LYCKNCLAANIPAIAIGHWTQYVASTFFYSIVLIVCVHLVIVADWLHLSILIIVYCFFQPLVFKITGLIFILPLLPTVCMYPLVHIIHSYQINNNSGFGSTQQLLHNVVYIPTIIDLRIWFITKLISWKLLHFIILHVVISRSFYIFQLENTIFYFTKIKNCSP